MTKPGDLAIEDLLLKPLSDYARPEVECDIILAEASVPASTVAATSDFE